MISKNQSESQLTLKALREKANLTQPQLSDRIGEGSELSANGKVAEKYRVLTMP
jgi:transcriptional regulator with XRE-family HTH domain